MTGRKASFDQKYSQGQSENFNRAFNREGQNGLTPIYMTTEEIRNNRKELVGFVRSKTGDKSIKVVYEYKTPHPLYKKEIRRKTTVHVHDEENSSSVGDKIKIIATRPLSKLKRWRVLEILEKAPVA